MAGEEANIDDSMMRQSTTNAGGLETSNLYQNQEDGAHDSGAYRTESILPDDVVLLNPPPHLQKVNESSEDNLHNMSPLFTKDAEPFDKQPVAE